MEVNKSPIGNPILYTNQLSVGYQNKKHQMVLEDGLNVNIQSGEMVCLIGPNGCGKSTLMRTIAGLQKPLAGETFITEVNVKNLKPHQYAQLMSLVLTDKINAGDLTVFDIVSIGRYPYTNRYAKLRTSDLEVIDKCLTDVHLSHYKHRFFNELSDGEKQRVMIAKALAQDTPLIMLDEPTAHLDLPNRVEIMNMLKFLARETGKAILLSTHELDLALQTADSIWLMSREQHMKSGAPEDLVLNGAFEKVFKSDAYQFDKLSGAFKVVRPSKGKIYVHGEDVFNVWTKRALERNGYELVCKSNAIFSVEYSNNLWKIENKNITKQCVSIGELLCELEALMH